MLTLCKTWKNQGIQLSSWFFIKPANQTKKNTSLKSRSFKNHHKLTGNKFPSWSTYLPLTYQPPEKAGLMIRAYENPLVSLIIRPANKNPYQTEGGYIIIYVTGGPWLTSHKQKNGSTPSCCVIFLGSKIWKELADGSLAARLGHETILSVCKVGAAPVH